MDFARIDPRRDAEFGATFHVEYEGEQLFHEGKPIEISFVGLQSRAGKRAAAHMVKDTDKKTGKKRDVGKMSVDEMLKLADESDETRAKFYAALTTGWNNIVYIPDEKMDDPQAQPEPLAYSKENAVMLFTTRPWLMEEVDGFLSEKSNFTRVAVTG